MERSRALALLKISEAEARNAGALRRAYRRRMTEVHPDVNRDPGAVEATVALTTAYELLLDPPPKPGPSRRRTQEGQRPGGTRGPRPRKRRRAADRPNPSVETLDDSCILVGADRETTFSVILEAAHSLGEIGYLDRSAWLVEVLVEFVEAPTSSIVMTLQARADGTEVTCSVEPLSGGEAPPIAPVTQLIARALRSLRLPD